MGKLPSCTKALEKDLQVQVLTLMIIGRPIHHLLRIHQQYRDRYQSTQLQRRLQETPNPPCAERLVATVAQEGLEAEDAGVEGAVSPELKEALRRTGDYVGHIACWRNSLPTVFSHSVMLNNQYVDLKVHSMTETGQSAAESVKSASRVWESTKGIENLIGYE